MNLTFFVHFQFREDATLTQIITSPAMKQRLKKGRIDRFTPDAYANKKKAVVVEDEEEDVEDEEEVDEEEPPMKIKRGARKKRGGRKQCGNIDVICETMVYGL